ncbi:MULTISPECIES: hypothetical protein [Paenibacillus]|nr:hypothetical protein [Paenibacillus tyrfis]MCP1308577.1 hypothetical protein [Paenibacillus tyrfis]GMX62712.1 hypothetical protein Elgi_25190 [Paenibacillus elgii]
MKLWVMEILLITLKQNFMLPTSMDGAIQVINVLDKTKQRASFIKVARSTAIQIKKIVISPPLCVGVFLIIINIMVLLCIRKGNDDMSRRTAGVVLLAISAFLTGVKYLTASIYSTSSPGTVYGPDSFKQWLDYVGGNLTTYSIITLIVGIIYLILAEIYDFDKK